MIIAILHSKHTFKFAAFFDGERNAKYWMICD